MSEEKNIEETPQEQPVNKEPSDEIISSAEPIAEAEKPLITNSSTEALAQADNQPQTEEEMEVHHHTHAAHGKKTWKDYFWEFLMLFLAVFCGFLAEYQLEHVIEHQREKQFIQSYIEDLKTDMVSIDRNLIFQKRRRDQLDSLIYFLSEQKIKGYENELYYLGRVLVRTTRFQSNDRTITQLKNSGSLRLIRNENAADSIISYQKSVDYIIQNIDD